MNVTLIYNGTVPTGKVFDCFTVDGVKVNGNTFATSAAEHSVGVVFVDNAADMTWTTASAEGAVSVNAGEGIWAKKLGNSEAWVMRYTVTNLPSGDWGQLTAVYLGATSQIVSLQFSGSTYTFGLYGGPVWSGSVTVSNDIAAVVKGASTENPVTLTFVKSGNDFTGYVALQDGTMYKIGTLDLSTYASNANATTDFGYAYRDPHFGAPTLNGDIEFVTGEGKVGLYTDSLKANISYTKASAVEAKDYFIGDTVTLTHDAAEPGYAFSHYTVDNTAITGDSFVVTRINYSVAAVYTEVSTLTLIGGVVTADGGTEYARGVKVVLSFDPEKLNGKVVDYYVIDKDTENEIRVYNGEFTTSAATHTVTAVLVAPEEITWLSGGTDYNYETVMGDAASEWKSRGLDGEVYGSAEYWAVSVYVKHTSEWQSFEFIQGTNQSIRVRFHQGGYCGVVLMTSKTNESIPSAEFTVAYPTKNEQVVNKLVAGATVTCVRNGNTISLYIDGYLFFTTNYAVDHTGNWFGVGHIDANDATKPEMSDTKFIVGKDKVEAYLATLAASGKTQSSATQINTLNGASAKDGSVVEYITTNIPEGLNDGTVTESGVLKVTAASNDVGIDPGWTFDKDASAYEEIYFYVYMEDAQTNNKAGIYWAGDTDLTASTWIKISMTNFGNANEDLSKLVLRVFLGYSQDDPAIAGKTFYVTAVYGVPKTAE